MCVNIEFSLSNYFVNTGMTLWTFKKIVLMVNYINHFSNIKLTLHPGNFSNGLLQLYYTEWDQGRFTVVHMENNTIINK